MTSHPREFKEINITSLFDVFLFLSKQKLFVSKTLTLSPEILGNGTGEKVTLLLFLNEDVL